MYRIRVSDNKKRAGPKAGSHDFEARSSYEKKTFAPATAAAPTG
jgi:hypothetical protein